MNVQRYRGNPWPSLLMQPDDDDDGDDDNGGHEDSKSYRSLGIDEENK